jgi:putative phage-type endonuclease
MPNPLHLIPAGVRVISDPETSRDDWLELRRTGIGGSDALAVAGMDPWKAPLGVYLEKTGIVESTVEETPLMRWGNMLEPVLADWFQATTGIEVFRCGMLGHPTREWQLFSPDRLTADGGILEIKTTGMRGAKAWADGKVADRAAIQLQHGMSVTGLTHGYAVAGIWGEDPVYRIVQRDNDLISDLVQIESEFWDQVTSDQPPALGRHPAEASLMQHLYPYGEEDSVDLSPQAYMALSQYVALGKQIKSLKVQQDGLKGAVTAELGTASEGLWQGTVAVTWRNPVSETSEGLTVGSRRFMPRL